MLENPKDLSHIEVTLSQEADCAEDGLGDSIGRQYVKHYHIEDCGRWQRKEDTTS
jgi:hypothetical protein